MGVKKLHSVFMRYVLLLALAVLLVIGVNVAVYLFGVETGAVVPLNRISAAIESSKEMLQSTRQILPSDIPYEQVVWHSRTPCQSKRPPAA